jgi:phosphoglycerate dehydrogenase-like enzyme
LEEEDKERKMHSVLLSFAKQQYGNIMAEEDVKRIEAAAKVTKKDLTRADDVTLIAALKEADADILVTGWGAPKVTPKVMDEWPKLKYVVHMAGDLKWFLDRKVLERGLVVTNWGDCTAQGTAEGALAMTFALLRNYHLMVDWMRRDRLYWETPRQDEGLFEQRVGLHGLGAIAQEYAKFLEPFRCRISAYSPHVPDDVFGKLGIKRAKTLEELYGSNRIISCHAANTPANYHIVNAKIFAAMEDGAYFINTGRGPVVDTQALIAELRKGRITAALDVYEEEPLAAESELRDLPNCFCIPHRAGPTPDQRKVMGRHAADNVIRFVRGERVEAPIDVRKFDLMT